jgi:DNA-binding transcriptional LysR family regulator
MTTVQKAQGFQSLDLISTFVRVVEAGSFTGAATQMGVPKSSVSRGVARLEEDLGVRLLQRTTRKLHLTEAGQRYFEQTRQALAGLEEASAEVADLGREPRGLVRLTTPVDFGEDSFAGFMATFLLRYPAIKLDLIMTGRRVDLVAEGVDLALRAGPLDDSSLVARRVAQTAFRLFAAPSYLQRKGRPRRFAELEQHDCIILRSGRGIEPWRLNGPRGWETMRPAGPVVVDDMGFVQRLARAGVGIALLPEFTSGDDLATGVLERVLPTYATDTGALYVVSPPLRHVPARVALLRDFLIEEVPKFFARRR